MPYARGKKAWGECARSGRRMLLKDMVADGYYPDLIVDPAWRDERHPQEHLPGLRDATSLYRPAPANLPAPTAPVLTGEMTVPSAGIAFVSYQGTTTLASSTTYNVGTTFELLEDSENVCVIGHHMTTNGNTLTGLLTRRVIVEDEDTNELYNEEVFLDQIVFVEVTANCGRWFIPLGDLPAGIYNVYVQFTYSGTSLRRVQMQYGVWTGVNQDDAAIPFDSFESYDDVAPPDEPLVIFPVEGELVVALGAVAGVTPLTPTTNPAFDEFAGPLAGSSFDMDMGHVIAQSDDEHSIEWNSSPFGGHFEGIFLLRPAE